MKNSCAGNEKPKVQENVENRKQIYAILHIIISIYIFNFSEKLRGGNEKVCCQIVIFRKNQVKNQQNRQNTKKTL